LGNEGRLQSQLALPDARPGSVIPALVCDWRLGRCRLPDCQLSALGAVSLGAVSSGGTTIPGLVAAMLDTLVTALIRGMGLAASHRRLESLRRLAAPGPRRPCRRWR